MNPADRATDDTEGFGIRVPDFNALGPLTDLAVKATFDTTMPPPSPTNNPGFITVRKAGEHPLEY